MTIAQIRAALREADEETFAVLERSLADDPRKGVASAVESARRRLAAERAECERLARLYRFEEELIAEREGSVAIGLDEVGRGPLAGPLTVGAVVLGDPTPIAGLNDSKQIRPEKREEVAACIHERADAVAIVSIAPAEIDRIGMAAALRTAFALAVSEVESQGIVADVVLLDGNPLKFDAREVNIVKGDARCASIAAASVVAKVARDALMRDMDARYPGYGFAENKGYASQAHIEAIERLGLCPEHRVSFCGSFMQQSLF